MSNSTRRKWRQIKVKKQRRRNVSFFLLLFNLFKTSTKVCKENPDFSLQLQSVASSRGMRRSWCFWRRWNQRSLPSERPSSRSVTVLAARTLQRFTFLSDRRLWLQVSSWIQHLIPKIEDGNDFGVAIQVTSPDQNAGSVSDTHTLSFHSLSPGKDLGANRCSEDQSRSLSDQHQQVGWRRFESVLDVVPWLLGSPTSCPDYSDTSQKEETLLPKLPKRLMWWVFVHNVLRSVRKHQLIQERCEWLWRKPSLINESPPPDGLSLTGPWQRCGHLLWDQSDRSRHSWILRELNRLIFGYFTHLLCAGESLLFCAAGWVLWHHQQESGQSDQSQRRREAFHVLKLWRSRIRDAFNSFQLSFNLLNHKNN